MRSQKAFNNLIFSLILQIVNSVVGIILPRLFIVTYGSSINGMVSSIRQFLGYLNLVEAGVGLAASTSLYGPLVQKDEKAINSILSAAKLFYIRSGFIFAVLTAGLSMIYPFIVKAQVDFFTSSVMVLILGGCGVAEFFLVGKYRVLLTADQRSYVISIVQIIGTVLNAAITLTLITLKFDVLITQAVSTLIYVSRVLLLAGYVRKNYLYLNFQAEPNLKSLDTRWDVFMHQIAGLLVFGMPTVIITVFCGLNEVSVYVVYNMVFTAVHQMISAFSNGLTAGFGEVIASDNRKSLLRGYANYEYVYYAVLTWAYTTTAVLIIPFIQLYIHGISDTNYIRPMVAALFVVVGVANNLRIPANTIVNSAGHFRQTKTKAIIEAGINLVVSIIMVRPMGIVGVLLGSVCSYAYRTTDFIFYASKNVLEQSSWTSWHMIFRNIAIGIISYILLVTYIEIDAANYLELVMWTFIVGMANFVVIFLVNWFAEPQMVTETFARLKSMVAYAEK